MAPLHEQYELRVTAGHTYDRSKHQDVPVNTEKPVHISSDLIDAQHPYDRYSISFSFVPKHDISGDKLVFGNDFEHPIRDRLPPLFDKAFGIVKWWIDPGLDGDVYGDEPYLYGALLSSINVLRIGDKTDGADAASGTAAARQSGEAVVYTEGADGSGDEVRKQHNIPASSSQRQKYFLTETNRKNFTFEAGREYKCDFFNPYLDFNEFALKIGYGLPNISIIGHWDGQPLRYTLKNKETNTELFVVVIQLMPTDQAAAVVVKSPEEEFKAAHGQGDEVEAENDDLD
ncbi:DUF1769-domain-containing protein [Lizonia empirigonia]|nr:DUF1769-domain-containing protein [Lizonia empirigonia]